MCLGDESPFGTLFLHLVVDVAGMSTEEKEERKEEKRGEEGREDRKDGYFYHYRSCHQRDSSQAFLFYISWNKMQCRSG